MTGEQFGRKTYGRIFVKQSADVEKVCEIIRELDEFEYEYMPDEFVAVYDSTNCPVTYGHKFELDMDRLRFACFNEAVPVMLVTNCAELQEWRDVTS